jgi:hypothetical protein
MPTPPSSPDEGLFYEALIRAYLAQRFVERPWLAEQIQLNLAEQACRLLLLTVVPGAGKTALMAWLADQHPRWPRYRPILPRCHGEECVIDL